MTDETTPDIEPQQRAEIIATTLPYLLRYDGKTIVVKYGGNAMGDGGLSEAFAEDITLLTLSGVNAVVVHGGGPQIGQMLTRLGIQSEFRDGLRVTDRATVEVVEMVLAGSINKS
ncbi:MAG: acetylglutamate kinase, partial [Pseudomonadota bacterium]